MSRQQSNRNTRNNNRNRNQTNQENEGFFDLKLTGIAYVNRLAERQSQDGSLFTTCTLAVLIGPKNTEKRQYRYIDVVVIGEKNVDLLWQYEQDIADERNVMIKFCLSDIQASAYERDDNTLGANLRSKLYAVEKVWVDGELTFESPKPQNDEQAPAPSENRQSSQRAGNRSSNRNTSQRQNSRSTRAA